MENLVARFSYRPATVLLFQVHVKRIEVETDIIHSGFFDELQALIDHVDHVGLKPVECFQRKSDVLLLGDWRPFPEYLQPRVAIPACLSFGSSR